MKRVFGILFIIFAVINLVIGCIGLGTMYQDKAIPKILFGLILFAIGSWLIKTKNIQEVNQKQFKIKIKKKKYKNEFPIKNK